jgi:hypothetical protein
MLKRSLVPLALIALAAPVASQEAPPTWSSDRPDGVAPAGVIGDRLLPAGAFEAQYRFRRAKFEGVQVETVPLEFVDVLDFYSTTPFQRSDKAYEVQLQYGVSDDLSLVGVVAWLDRSRDLIDDEFLVGTDVSGVSDLFVEALWGVWDRDAIRVHLHVGAEIPIGSIEERGDLIDSSDQVLAYEMQLGTGSFGVVPGITAQIQNEFATVGAQVRGRIRLNDNDRDYRLGDEVEGSAWAAYRFNRFFAVNAGARLRTWGTIQGVDSALDPTRDPGEDAVFSGGERVDVPIGMNVYLPEGKLAGHRLAFEFVFPVHQDYDAVRMTGETGFTLAWRKMF